MKKFISYISILLIGIISVHAQILRNDIPLNGNWRFIIDSTNAGEAQHWQAGLPVTAKTVQVPHTWNVMKGLEDYSGLACYEKAFALDTTDARVLMGLGYLGIGTGLGG